MLTAFVMTACFTGVESTPKITEADVRSQQAQNRSPEAVFFDSLKYQPFREWKSGKRFLVTEQRISLVLDPQFAASDTSIVGRTLTYESVGEVVTITGLRACDISLRDSLGKNHKYRINASLDELKRRNHVEIPFTIELDVVESAGRMLNGNTYYLINSNVQDINGRSTLSPKFLPVVIEDTKPASQFSPIRVTIRYTSMPEVKRQVLLGIGPTTTASRMFENNFSFTDPRTSHTSVTENHWQMIVNNQVAMGMTREECRLALGKPAHIDRIPARDGLHEIWTYDGGVTLSFVDGLLTEQRK